MKTNIHIGYLLGVVAFFIFVFGAGVGKVFAYCTVPTGQSATISESCVFQAVTTYIDGAPTQSNLNSGSLTISNGTLNITGTQTIVFGTMTLSGGSIALDTGGLMRIGEPVWMVDADSDGYPANAVQYAQAQAPTNGRRKYLMVSTTELDCSDTNYNPTNVCCDVVTWYKDADGDGYGNPAGPTTAQCSPPPATYVANNTDCDDTQALVYISHTACYWDLDGDTYTNGNTAGKTCINNASCALATYGSLGGGVAPTQYTQGRILNSASALTDCNDGSSAVRTTSVTGGTVTSSGGYTTHTFTTSGTLTVNCPANLTAEVLIVGGGGNGGAGGATAGDAGVAGGGGGGGGVIYSAAMSITSGAKGVTVGGGTAASSFNSSTAGAGASAGQGAGGSAGTNGFSGGAGGGKAGGGGGGRGAVGTAGYYNGSCGTCSTGGNGGTGLTSSISGASLVYGSGGGGGGGTQNSNSNGIGGSGGSGAGNGGSSSGWAPASSSVGGAGTANRGGGGGGGGATYSTSAAGGAGSSGIVIVKYANP